MEIFRHKRAKAQGERIRRSERLETRQTNNRFNLRETSPVHLGVRHGGKLRFTPLVMKVVG